MGNSSGNISGNISGSVGANIGGSVGGNVGGNVLASCYRSKAAFQTHAEFAQKNTVANATGRKLRIFYHSEEIQLEDLVVKEDSETTKRFFKSDTQINFFDLPPDDFLEFSTEGEMFASIFTVDAKEIGVCSETIHLNYQVPLERSLILTANNEIKFRKSGGGIWIEEDGSDHRPKTVAE